MTFLWLAVGAIIALVVYDLTQRNHAVLRNFPIIGHFRYWLEAVGPELRQYIVTNNDEERPFSRDERRWVYASSKRLDNYFGFGSDNEMELTPNYLIIKHAAFPLRSPHEGEADHDPKHEVPCLKVIGEHRSRPKAFRPSSVVNVSGMSFGALSGSAIEALNRGAALSGCFQNTGEGGISSHHLHGGDLIWQIGTGYFGCRELNGDFSMTRLKETVARYPLVRAIEIKLSQGAKPGMGGLLPRHKITKEIAAIRGIATDRDCASPSAHTVFHDTDGLLDFVESIASETGLPVGIKSAVGESNFWIDLGRLMARDDRGVDFVTIDGGEGGTGASPLVFSDHVALPFKVGFSRVHQILVDADVADRIVFIGSAKLGLPEPAVLAFSLGCDLINVGREPLLAIGCIQAQRCHTNHCPTGIATQNRWLVRGLDPQLKSVRLANYIMELRHELLAIARTCGVEHPALISPTQLELLDDRFGSRTVAAVFGSTR
jgi:glutamate synthase domain-containing protein 2